MNTAARRESQPIASPILAARISKDNKIKKGDKNYVKVF